MCFMYSTSYLKCFRYLFHLDYCLVRKMLDVPTLSVLFDSPFMDLNLAHHLSLVSHQFLNFARSFQRKIKEVDLRSICKNQGFQNEVLHAFAIHSPNLRAIKNVEAVNEKSECLQVLSSIHSLTNLHLTYFKLSEYNVACLAKIQNLDSLSIDTFFWDKDLDLERIKGEAAKWPKLNLSHLKIGTYEVLELMCHLDQLKSLSVEIDILLRFGHDDGGSPRESLEAFCANLLRPCTLLESLHIDAALQYAERLIPTLIHEIESLPSLRNFSMIIHSCCDLRQVENITWNIISENVTQLICPSLKYNSSGLAVFNKFPRLRHLELSFDGSPDTIFELLPHLQSVVLIDSQFVEKFFLHDKFAVGLRVISKLHR